MGNNREVVNKEGRVVQTNNYYPFGMLFCDGTKNYLDQKHKYNGKEFDNMYGLNTYDYGARQYNPVTLRWDRMDPLCEKDYGTSPYVYCGNNPVNRFDPDGMDWYWDTDHTLQYNPNVHSAKDMQKGQEYVGATYSNKYASFRKDGSILFNNETKAYNRMWNQANRHYRAKGEVAGREEGGFVLADGKVLVMPDYKNDESNAHMDTGGYTLKEGHTLVHGKERFSVVGQVHTHQNKGNDPSPSFYDPEKGYGDLGYSCSNNSIPVFTLGWDGYVYGIRGYVNNGRIVGKIVSMRNGENTLKGLLSGSYSLRSVIKRLPNLYK